MTKPELVTAISEEMNVSKQIAKKVIDCFLLVASREIIENGEFILFPFGKFYVNQLKARNSRNPKTGETFLAPPTKILRFRPGEALKKAINAPRKKKWQRD